MSDNFGVIRYKYGDDSDLSRYASGSPRPLLSTLQSHIDEGKIHPISNEAQSTFPSFLQSTPSTHSDAHNHNNMMLQTYDKQIQIPIYQQQQQLPQQHLTEITATAGGYSFSGVSGQFANTYYPFNGSSSMHSYAPQNQSNDNNANFYGNTTSAGYNLPYASFPMPTTVPIQIGQQTNHSNAFAHENNICFVQQGGHIMNQQYIEYPSSQLSSSSLSTSEAATVVIEICKVCGTDENVNKSYSSTVCNACKCFFCHSGSPNKYKCLTEQGNCIITKNDRKCRLCRYKKCIDVGMEKKPRIVKNKKNLPIRVCKICGLKTLCGIHYGVQCCEGCKGIFKRYIDACKKNESICTNKEKNCSELITPKCKQCCRLRQCINGGMKKGATKRGRPKKH